MSTQSKIEWTDATWNPTRGCSLKSPGCTNCYAMKQAHRFSGPGGAYEGLTKMTRGGPVWTGTMRLVHDELATPLRWAKPRRVFVDSMSDLFHEDVPFDFIDSVFFVMSVTTRHTYQVLTKRPERMLEYFRSRVNDLDPTGFPDKITEIVHKRWVDWRPQRSPRQGGYDNCGPAWPLENVWLGVSVEDQERADERIPLLLKAPSAIRFLSCEPLLEAVDVEPYLLRTAAMESGPRGFWCIVGGESGPGARPFNVAWARSIVEQCKRAGVATFVKQLGAVVIDRNDAGFEGAEPREWPIEHQENGRIEHVEEGYQGAPVRIRLNDRKGGDWNEWPADLRVRAFPR